MKLLKAQATRAMFALLTLASAALALQAGGRWQI